MVACYKSEQAFRQELFLCLILFPIPFLLPIDPVEKALMVYVLIQVLIAELANSALEAIVDRISLEHHPLCKVAKDIGSALVMLSLIAVALVWGIIILN